MSEEQVILVNENDFELGTMNKMEAHLKGELHRAFSVFLFNDRGELLLQKRALSKYHSPGLWTNSCCSHPRPNEDIKAAAIRRLKEEMGIANAAITNEFSFVYKQDVGLGLTEHEYDHIFFGVYNGSPNINTDEVCDWKYVSLTEIEHQLISAPGNYTIWFKMLFERVKNHISK